MALPIVLSKTVKIIMIYIYLNVVTRLLDHGKVEGYIRGRSDQISYKRFQLYTLEFLIAVRVVVLQYGLSKELGLLWLQL